MKYEIHKNIDDEIDEDELYNTNEMSVEKNKQNNCSFEIKLWTICNTKRLNGMNFIHDIKLNKIPEYYLLNNILNPSKRNKNINSYYYNIRHGCMDTQNGRAKKKDSYYKTDVVTQL